MLTKHEFNEVIETLFDANISLDVINKVKFILNNHIINGWISINELLPPENHDVFIAYRHKDNTIEVLKSNRLNHSIIPNGKVIKWVLPQFYEQVNVVAWREIPIFDFL